MTLIIKAITLKWAFSISDRLLTQKTTNGYNPFDAVSNKTILFFSSDAMVSISYTGSAYIGKIPTDRWISEKLCGLDLSEGNDFKLIVKSGKWKNLYNSIEYLIEKLNQEWPSLPRAQKKVDIGLLICGWLNTKSKPHWRPILWYLDGSGTTESPFFIKRYPRFWPLRQLATISTGVQLNNTQNNNLKQAILDERKNGTEQSAEQAIVKELRHVSKTQPTIGNDCMAIRMSWNAKPQVIITYYPNPDIAKPLPPKKAPIESRSGMIIGFGKLEDIPNKPPEIEGMEPYFSPWIISQQAIIPPSSILGTLNHSIGNLTVQINGPSPPNGIIGGLISQKRPTKP